jgi:hypothetical protein
VKFDPPQDVLNFKPGDERYQKFLDEAAREQREKEKERQRLAAIEAEKRRAQEAIDRKRREAEAAERARLAQIEREARELKEKQYWEAHERLTLRKKTYARAWGMLAFGLSCGVMAGAAQVIRPIYESTRAGMPPLISVPFHLLYFAAVIFGWWLAYAFIQDWISQQRGKFWLKQHPKEAAVLHRMDGFDPDDWPDIFGGY